MRPRIKNIINYETFVGNQDRFTRSGAPVDQLLAEDLADAHLSGGGALLAGMDRLLMQETGLPVFVADDPLLAVAKGTGVMLQELDVLARHE